MPHRSRLEQYGVGNLFFTDYVILHALVSRTHTRLANSEIQVAGDQWAIFLYTNYTYDPKDLWNGLLHSGLLVSVSTLDTQSYVFHTNRFS